MACCFFFLVQNSYSNCFDSHIISNTASLFMQHSLGQALEEMDYGLTNMIS